LIKTTLTIIPNKRIVTKPTTFDYEMKTRTDTHNQKLKQVNTSNYYISGFKEMTLLATKENKKKDFTVNNAIYIKAYKQVIGGISK